MLEFKKIIFTGGGTAGSVTPLLAIYDKLNQYNIKEKKYNFFWVGTYRGVEKNIIKKYDIIFYSIFSGKFRRYFSIRNFLDPFLIIIGFFQSLVILKKLKPNLVLSAGSFVSVPVVLAAYILKTPIIIHQLDIKPGLANKIMSYFAKTITVSFKNSLKDYKTKAIWTGCPIRSDFKKQFNKQKILNNFNLKQNFPILLVLGGGTGALAINKMIVKTLPELTKFCQIIHITGKNKALANRKELLNYHNYEFLQNIADAMFIADIIVSRAGIGTLSELSYLAKPSIIIPIPYSHQEKNAEFFEKHKAIIFLKQQQLSSKKFIEQIKKLLLNKESQQQLSKNIAKLTQKNSEEKIINEILKLA